MFCTLDSRSSADYGKVASDESSGAELTQKRGGGGMAGSFGGGKTADIRDHASSPLMLDFWKFIFVYLKYKFWRGK